MNSRSYKTVFSKRLGALVAVGEHATSQGKANGASGPGASGANDGAISALAGIGYVAALSASFAFVSLAWAAPATNALPTGGTVVQGAASMSQTANQLNIQQATQRAAINWQSFDIGSQARVQVYQPNAQAVLLNRVVGQSPSQIFGKLQANGHVILVNPNGVLFGKDGSVNAGGFTASTLNISDANFMAGNMVYERNGSTAGIQNLGNITAEQPGGYVALLGATVSNEGSITTKGGSVVMGAGETIKVPVSGTGRIKLELTPAAINASLSNSGSIVTEGGQVYMQALALNRAAAQILQSGSIDTTGEKGGDVHVLADGGHIRVSGSIKANSTNGTAGGDIYIGRDKDTNILAAVGDVRGAKLESKGGFVETSGQYLATHGVSVKAKEWLLDPSDITISNSTDNNISGTSPSDLVPTNSGSSNVAVSTIQTAINAGTSVTIKTTNSASPSTTGAGNITIVDALVFANNSDRNAALSLIADNGIIQNTSATITTNTVTGKTGLVHINMEAKGNYQGIEAPSQNSDGININAGISTNGNITLKGSTSKDGNEGVYIGGITLKAQNIDITGTATGAATVPENAKGIRSFGTLNATDSITLKGTSTNVTGVGLEGGSVTAGGAVLIEGKASSGIYQGTNIGFNVTGASVKITGETRDNLGVGIGANVTATTGDVIIEGKSVNGRGVDINSGKVVKATQGDVKITGTSTNARGIDVGNQTPYAPVAQIIAGKNIILDGTGKAGGVRIWGDSVLKAGTFTPAGVPDVLGDINITGTSSASDGVNLWRFPKAARFEASQDIIINGTANGVSGSGFTTTTSDLNAQAPMMIAGRDFKLTATNSNTGNTGNVINGQSGLQVTAVGDIKLNAIKPNSTGNAIYFYSQTNALGGNASFKSTNSNGDVLIQANQGGIIFQNAYTGTPSSPYTSSTDISGRNITIDNTGGTVTVNATTGKATLTQGTTGTSTTNGINLASIAGIKIDATKNINLSGKSTGAVGVLLGGGIKVRADGDVNIKGTTTLAGAVQGVYLSGASSVEGKNVDIKGSAFNGNGVLSYAAINATTGGSASITGTSTGTGGSASALSLWANVTADQNVTLKGENTNIGNTPAAVFTNKAITATNGKIDVTAITKGTSANALQLDATASLIAATEINLKADTLSISNAATINAGAGAGKVTITTDSADAKINIGNGTGTGVSASGVDAGSITTRARTLGLSNAELNRITAGSLVIGDISNVGSITVSAATATNATTGNVTLQTGDNIAINAPLTVGTITDRKNLELKAGGGQITQAANATITANQLSIQAAQASVALAAAANQVNQLAANVKSLDFKNGKALQIGVGNAGITASGRIKVETTTGNLTIAKSVATTNEGLDAVVLNAGADKTFNNLTGLFEGLADGNIVAGGGAVTVGEGGVAQLYTGSTSENTASLAGGDGTGRYRYNSDESTTNFSKALEAGVNVIYREAPEVTVKVNDVNKVYDGVAHSGGSFSSASTADGVKNGDADALVGSNAVFSGNAQGVKDVLASVGKTISASDNGKNALGYKKVTYKEGNLSIAPRPLTIAPGSVATKTADGTTAATVTPGALSNLVGTETLGVAATGTFSDANAGNNKAVNAFYTLQNGANGGVASNYILALGKPGNPDTRMTGNILASVNPVINPTPLPVNNNTGSRVSAVSGFGTSGAATGVLDDKAVTESREVCSDVFPENCECQPSVIPSIEICFAPKSVAATKEEK